MSEKETTYIALLRGINVGGKNLIKMDKLKACFVDMGFGNVRSYIQSGNIVFTTNKQNLESLEAKIETMLTKAFNYTPCVVVVEHSTLAKVVGKAPYGFGRDPKKYRYDVFFLKKPLTPKEVMKTVPIKEGVDRAYEGKHVLYFSRLIARATQSRLSRIVALPVYKNLTIRNWNTTTKLLSLCEG